MTGRSIIDAGPALNFFASNQERLLLAVVGGRVSAPETVENEVMHKARRDVRFSPATAVWARLARADRLTVLSDDPTPELEAAVQRIANMPMAPRQRHAKDLGETMVVAHAATRAESGIDVVILIDDGPAAHLATAEMRRMEQQAKSGCPVGRIDLIDTPTVLSKAAGTRFIPDRSAMRAVYDRMRALDDGLVRIEQTSLLSSEVWAG